MSKLPIIVIIIAIINIIIIISFHSRIPFHFFLSYHLNDTNPTTPHTHVPTNPSSNLFRLPHSVRLSPCISSCFTCLCHLRGVLGHTSSYLIFLSLVSLSGLFFGMGRRPPALLVWRA
jgi:hypothetical protein